MNRYPAERRGRIQFSLWSVLLGILVVACLLAVFVHFQQRGARLEKRIYDELVASRCFSTQCLSITVIGLEGQKLIRPTIESESRGTTTIITADAAWISEISRDGKQIMLRCQNANIETEAARVTSDSVTSFTLPTSQD